MNIKEDKLNRSEFLDNIFKIIDNFSDLNNTGLTIILNGKYGSGKTTVLDFLEERCKSSNNEYNTIRYNAWENNTFDNPMISILYKISKLENLSDKALEAIQNIIRNLPSAAIKFVSNKYGINIDDLTKKSNIFNEITNYNYAINDFKNLLKAECQNKKLIFLVDELDRCLPEYQIKTLENLYHLLDIPNLTVIIAIDRTLLENAIQKEFGNELDTYSYLAKFIKYEIELPNEETYNYVLELHDYDCDNKHEIANVISNMFKSIELPIRECQRIIEELNLICKSGHYDMYWCPVIITFLLILKHKDNQIFNNYILPRDTYFPTTITSLDDTKYMNFVKHINGTKTEIVLNYLKQDKFAKTILINLISFFDSLQSINKSELVDYISRESEFELNMLIKNIVNNDVIYKNIQNEIINKIKILN